MCALRFCLQGPMGPCLSFSHCCVLGRIDVATNKAHGKGPVPYTLHASPEKRCHTQSLNKGYETRCVLKFYSNLQTQKQLFGFFFLYRAIPEMWGQGCQGKPWGCDLLRQNSDVGPAAIESHRSTPPSCGGDITNPVGPKSRTLSQRGLCQSIRSLGVCPARLWTCWNLSPLSSFQFLPCGLGMSLLCLSWHCILPIIFSLTSSYLGNNFCLRINYFLSLTHIFLGKISIRLQL